MNVHYGILAFCICHISQGSEEDEGSKLPSVCAGNMLLPLHQDEGPHATHLSPELSNETVSMSPPQLLLSSTHLRGERGTHLLFELSKRLPNPIPAEDQGLAVGKALYRLLQALAHGFVKKRNVCGSLDVAVGHLGGRREHPCVQGTGKEKKRLFNITYQYSSPHLEGLSAC